MARGSVPDACDSTCTMPPAGIASPNRSTSSIASRVTQVTVGLTRITSSTAAPPSSGRSASSAHWSGCRRKVCRARPSWLRVVSMPAKARNTRPTISSRAVSASSVLGGDQGADEVVARMRTAVGDHGLDVRRQPFERRLDPRQVLAHPDAEGLAEVVGPVRDLRPLLLGQAEQQAQHAGGVRLGELAHELDPPARRERVDQLAGELPGTAAASPRSPGCGTPGRAAVAAAGGPRPPG